MGQSKLQLSYSANLWASEKHAIVTTVFKNRIVSRNCGYVRRNTVTVGSHYVADYQLFCMSNSILCLVSHTVKE